MDRTANDQLFLSQLFFSLFSFVPSFPFPFSFSPTPSPHFVFLIRHRWSIHPTLRRFPLLHTSLLPTSASPPNSPPLRAPPQLSFDREEDERETVFAHPIWPSHFILTLPLPDSFSLPPWHRLHNCCHSHTFIKYCTHTTDTLHTPSALHTNNSSLDPA